MTAPRVSVILTAFNRERYIEAAIRSVLDQTLSPLEVIVVDDGSTDSTVERIVGMPDARIKLVRKARNQGIPSARNTGLQAAVGDYIAWLDSDDLALPNRLERQAEFLARNPSVAMIGSCASKMSASGHKLRGIRVPPLSHNAIRAWLLFRSAFQQSSITGRAKILKQYPYDPEFPVCEDVDMFVRVARDHRVANMPEVLVQRRIHSGQTIRESQEKIISAQSRIAMRALDKLGFSCSDDDIRRYVFLGGSFGSRPDGDYLDWADQWLQRLVEANSRSLEFDTGALRLAAAFFWARACLRCSSKSTGLKKLASSPISRWLAAPQARQWLTQAASIRMKGR